MLMVADRDALARGQAIGLDDQWTGVAPNVGFGSRLVVEGDR